MRRIFAILAALIVLSALAGAYAADPVLVESISLDQAEVRVPVKKTVQVKATVEPKNASNRKIVWTSSDETVATVKDGRITGAGPGTAVITATAADESGASASVAVTVVNPVRKITLSETKTFPLSLWVPWRIEAMVEPADASIIDVIWTSSDEKVATVDGHGVVTGVGKGTARITATAADGSGIKASVSVKVKEYDLVFTEKKSQPVTYYYTSGYIVLSGKVKTGNVRIPQLSTTILAVIGGDAHTDEVSVTPVAPGEDVVTINTRQRKFVYEVFVSPEAFPESPVAPHETAREEKADEPGEILFMGIPWGASYPESKNILSESQIKVNALGQRSGYLRAIIQQDIPFSGVTAYNGALNFHYSADEADFQSINSLYQCSLYFDPSVPYEQIQIAVRKEYGLDKGTMSDENMCTWKQGRVTLVLTKKDQFSILEMTVEE